MASQILSNISGFLKQFYVGPIREELNNSSVLHYRFQKNEEDVSGQNLTAYIPMFYQRNQGIGFRSEGGTLPTAGNRSHVQAQIGMAYLYGQIAVSGQAIKGSRDNAYAFAKVIDNEVRGMVEGLKIESNRAWWGDGSGALAKITQANGSITAGNYLTVDNAALLESGMVIDVWTAKTGGTQHMASVVINQVDRRNNKISLTTTQTVTQNDLIFRENSRGLYPMGLTGLVDGYDSTGALLTTTVQAISRTANLWWQGNVLDNAGTLRKLSLTLMQQAFELGEIIGQGRCSVILSTYALRRSYLDLEVADRRFVDKMVLDGGFSALEYSGGGEPVPMVVDYMAPANQMWFLDERTFAIYRASDYDWMDLDGAVLRKSLGVDQYEATAYAYMNLGCTAANKNSVMRDVQ